MKLDPLKTETDSIIFLHRWKQSVFIFSALVKTIGAFSLLQGSGDWGMKSESDRSSVQLDKQKLHNFIVL